MHNIFKTFKFTLTGLVSSLSSTWYFGVLGHKIHCRT